MSVPVRQFCSRNYREVREAQEWTNPPKYDRYREELDRDNRADLENDWNGRQPSELRSRGEDQFEMEWKDSRRYRNPEYSRSQWDTGNNSDRFIIMIGDYQISRSTHIRHYKLHHHT